MSNVIQEVILSATTDMLFRKFVSSDLLRLARREQIHADVMKWKELLLKINAVLYDAEEKQMTEQSVRIWLDDLRNLVFDVEDMLDEFQTEAFRRKLLLEPVQPCIGKLLKLVPSCVNLSPRSIMFDSMMISKIKKITARFQEIVTQKDQLGLNEISGGRSKKIGQRLPTTSLVNEAKVYGREKDKEEMVELLLRDDLGSDDGFSVLTIIGMGGIGKTTLAQLVYNDARIQYLFELKAWTCVSEDFDVVRVTKSILRSISKETVDDDDLNLLQEQLKKKLFGKHFLFVLDDVWNENYNDWTLLSLPFEAGAPGSKIIVTTRNQGVAASMGTLPAYLLKELSNDDCLCVFMQHALGIRDFSLHQSLKEIGENIVMKCNGLPLAAKTLGGLLRNKCDPNDWEDVLHSKIWNLPKERCDIIPALRVSYHYLSPCLKQCFAYCSLLPKDYEFQEEEIILLWMAEGFLQQEDSVQQMEDLGRKLFQELYSRSFFQQSSSNTSRFVMHDLINDLAQWAAGEICFRLEDVLEGKKKPKFSKNLRHLSYIRGQYDGIKRFEPFYDIKHLRTFLPIVSSDTWSTKGYLAYNFLRVLSKLRRLRVLSLNGYCIFKLPNSIGDLKHLRYLNLSETRIKVLPESVNKLYNLETLILEGCCRLKKLCADMGKLIKLHHLNNSNVDSLEEMPLGIGKLTSLQMLCCFVVGKDSGSRLKELKFLMQLRGTLKISKLENVKDAGDAMEAKINEKKNLIALLLEWSSVPRSRHRKIEERVLDVLKPHRNLKELTIRNYGGAKIPIWLEDCSLSNLVLLRFEFCHSCTSLPSIGHLPCLKHLFISRMDGVKGVALEFYGSGSSVPFPSLDTLCFEDMQEWEDWSHHGSDQEVEGFLHLRELSLVSCPKLRGTLPKHLPSLERLVIQSCEQLLVTLPSLPTLKELEISGFRKVVWTSAIDLSSLKSVVIGDISNQVFLTRLFKQQLPNLEELEIDCCEELTYLWQNEIELVQDISSIHQLKIASCPQLLSLAADEEQDQLQERLPHRLQYLKLSRCQGLVKPPQALLSLSSLRDIRIFDCDSLVSFPDAALSSRLKTITIMECNALKSLPEAWMHNTDTSLESLYIGYCNSLTYIARVQLPPSLRRLEIRDCGNLRTLIEEEDNHNDSRMYTSLLEYLEIRNCPSLTSLWSMKEVRYCSNHALCSLRRSNPLKALKYLYVFDCSKLESITKRLDNGTSLEIIMISGCNNLQFLPDDLHKLCHLQEICISHCPNLISFPIGGLFSMKLTKLSINVCEKLNALPNCMHNFTSLQHLAIGNCPSIVSFPEDGFPTNLTSLEIHDMKICKPLLKWGLLRFTCIRRLSIGGCMDVVSFPQEEIGMILPTSLKELRITSFPDLERLSSFGSLECLYLAYCPKLNYFPEKCLPTSLLQLHIESCPLLEEKFRKYNGQCRHLIAHIPYVSINYSWVSDYASEED